MEYKGYTIESDGTMGMFNIKPIGRGSVPAELRGAYTTRPFAMKAIDRKQAEKATNGKAKSN